MSDDKLKKMLDDAAAQKANKDSAASAAKLKLENDTRESGIALKERLMPRLLAAQSAWAGKADLAIRDDSAKFNLSDSLRVYPSIAISISRPGHAAYTFQSHSPGYVAVYEGAHSKGNTAYQFQVNKLDDLTDEKIDEILEAMVKEAHGLIQRR